MRRGCVLVVVLLALGAALAPSAPAVPRLYTIAGGGPIGSSGDGGPAPLAHVRAQCIAGLADGSVLVAEPGRVRRVRRDGTIVTVAGTGRVGFSGDGGPATRARIAGCAVAGLPGGGFVIADAGNDRLRRVGRDGVIATIAGTGEEGSAGDGGPALAAQLEDPGPVAVQRDGSILVMSAGQLRQIGRDGRIDTVAGIADACDGARGQAATGVLLYPQAIAPLADGAVLLADGDCVVRVTADGRIVLAARDVAAEALAPLPDGGFLVGGYGSVNRVGPAGDVTRVAGCEGNGCLTGDGPARSVTLGEVGGVALEPDGGFLLAAPERVARVDAAGMLTTVALVGGRALAREHDGEVLLSHPDAGGGAPGGTVLRIAPDGGTSVAAGGGAAAPRVGVPATAVALDPGGVQSLPDGFAVLDASRGAVVDVTSAGTIARVIPLGRDRSAGAFAQLGDGTLLAARYQADAPRVQRLTPSGAWETVAGGPLAPAPGVPATSVTIAEDGGFAPLRGGRLLVQSNRGQLWVGRDGRIERIAHVWLADTPLAPGPNGTALFALNEHVRRIAADGSVTTLAGNHEAGFFGSSDGEPGRFADLSFADIVAAAPLRGGGVLFAHDGRVLWLAPDRTRRLGLAITRRSLALLRRHRIAIRTTVPARVLLVARRRGHAIGRVRAGVRAGETPLALPRGLAPGELSVIVRATTRDGQRAWAHHRFLLGSRLPLATARRLVEGVACRRFASRRVACAYTDVIEGSNETSTFCTVAAVSLRGDGIIYVRDGVNRAGRCTRRLGARLLARAPVWRGGVEAPPL